MKEKTTFRLKNVIDDNVKQFETQDGTYKVSTKQLIECVCEESGNDTVAVVITAFDVQNNLITFVQCNECLKLLVSQASRTNNLEYI